MQDITPSVYMIEGFRLDLARRRLLDPDGHALALPARAYDVLAYLVEHRARVVGKDELMRAVWSRVVVEENNLNQAIYSIRKALGDSRGTPRFIVTIAGRGYQFIADARPEFDGQATVAATAAEPPVPGKPAAPAAPQDETPVSEVDLAPTPAPAPAPRSRRWFLAVGGAAAAGLAGAAYWLGTPRATQGLPQSIAVLPFKPLVAAAGNDALELGLTESMINRLSELPGVVVSPLSSVRRYSDQGVDAQEAGRTLRVAAVLDGHVQVESDRLRLTVRLVDVNDGRSLWAGSFNEHLDDFFRVQESLANQLVRALSLELSDAQRNRLARPDTTNAEAWQLYLNGRYHWDRKTEDGVLRAIEFYEAAAARDPQFALPHAGLADAYAVLGVFDIRPPGAVFPLARAAAERAIEIDELLGEAHASLGHVATQFDREWREGERLYRHALSLRPNHAQAVMWLANSHLMQGRIPEALAEARHAQLLEPMSLTFAANVGMVLSYAGRLDAALEQLQGLHEAAPDSPLVRHHLARLHVLRGEPDAAIRLVEGFAAPAPGSLSNLGRAYALAGRADDARSEIVRLRALGERGFGVGYDTALIHAALGEGDPTLAALQRALDDHSQMVGFINVDPGFDSLRREPRFRDVVERMGLG